jgi:hypothetical protein
MRESSSFRKEGMTFHHVTLITLGLVNPKDFTVSRTTTTPRHEYAGDRLLVDAVSEDTCLVRLLTCGRRLSCYQARISFTALTYRGLMAGAGGDDAR